MDDLNVKVSPIPKRTVTFEVTKEEAARIVLFLKEANFTGVQAPQELRRVVAGFNAIAEDREFGGH